MRKTREIIRLASGGELSLRQIASSCRVSPTTVSKVAAAAEAGGLLRWPLPEMTEAELRFRLFGEGASSAPSKPLPDMEHVAQELSRRGVTRQILWEEYRRSHPDGFGYTQFCEYLRQWRGRQEPTMRFEHKAGEKLFVDWAGQTVRYGRGGTAAAAYLFVAVLGASNYTFASVYPDMKMQSWIRAHMEALEFFGGVPELIVPDNARTAVKRACRYDPETNRTYQELAEHYGTAVLPTRVRKPQDKGKVECAVRNAEQRILAALRNAQFPSFNQLREAVAEKNRELNQRPFAKMDGCRGDVFESMEMPALKPLPRRPFCFGNWSSATIYKDYHFQLDGHYYSVPYEHVGAKVEVRATDRTVEVFLDGMRLATHKRSFEKGKASTLAEHRTGAHRHMLERDADQFLEQADRLGPHCRAAVERIFEKVPHPEMGFRGCAGILRLGRQHGAERLDAACRRALECDVVRYRTIRNLLENRMETQPDSGPRDRVVSHGNIRGPGYYNRTEGRR